VGAVRFGVKYFEEIVAGSFMVVMSLTTFANVMARYFFNSPIQWAEELARYSFIWVVFLGAVVCTKRQRHITIDILPQLLPARAAAWLRVLADLCTLGIALVIAYYGLKLTAAATQITATLKIPHSVVYIVVPVSAGLIFLHGLRDTASHLRIARRKGEQAE
jgi:TRAP-type C4-dicarboxylate transport system permease small subunit